MSRLLNWFAGALFSAAASAAPVTYNFQGVVGEATGIYSSIPPGTLVTGTYTIDFSNEIASQSQGVVGDQIYSWVAEAHGGADYDLPALKNYVFASTAEVDGFSYSTGPPGAYISRSYVAGSYSGVAAYESELNYSYDEGDYGSSSEFVINGGETSAGLPLFSTASTSTGYFTLVGQGQVTYQITSLTLAPVPLPAAAWLMLGGLGGIGALARKKRTGSPALVH